ncbi:MAG: hypothetical protein EZS28_014737 [Streblomastix strix]|uniref:Uncharacterized protein n=1 Tax=Streblomastix strix TaxID=222440 RepID=A0A5J4W550_9EUKA|nr:MAG: hypothetical protein EZS28_014737 [Streblomastix strix]
MIVKKIKKMSKTEVKTMMNDLNECFSVELEDWMMQEKVMMKEMIMKMMMNNNWIYHKDHLIDYKVSYDGARGGNAEC